MKRLLLRADDLGFSEAVNYGIAKTVQRGLIRNCGVMVNMDATEHAVRLFGGLSCCLGLHCNVSVGRPILGAEQVPTLVDGNGLFHSSREYRNAREEFASVEDLVKELTAQYKRFYALFGRKPAYFEAHAVESRNLAVALERVAQEQGLLYQPSFQDFSIGQTRVINIPIQSMAPDYDARAAIRAELSRAEEDKCYLYVCHPGYLDAYLLKNTSLTLARTDEVDMLCDPEIERWLTAHGFTLVTYDQLAEEGNSSKAGE